MMAAAGFAAFATFLATLSVPLGVFGGVFMLWLGWRGLTPRPMPAAAEIGARDLLHTTTATFLLTMAKPDHDPHLCGDLCGPRACRRRRRRERRDPGRRCLPRIARLVVPPERRRRPRQDPAARRLFRLDLAPFRAPPRRLRLRRACVGGVRIGRGSDPLGDVTRLLPFLAAKAPFQP
ncbi:threonine efflux protein (plasmid) [Sinorhizobium americanum]|uniref:Threonine efflux protein n=1 Tax=Sinorhizobium americanum TaxID=194963 RepID=A0A1L3LWK1_9HYPH|nr:threonine efflux protein [Sinorhizobium americanum]